MKKFLSVFKISLQQEFAYRLNFIMWRVRNVMQFFLVFFLWSSIFSDPSRIVFGYDKAKILTYVFGILVIRAIVFSAKSDEVAKQIGLGEISTYLLKPINFFKYWFTRDIASKVLNLAFGFFEIILLFFILRPPFFFQGNPFYLLTFLISVVFAIMLYFLFNSLLNLSTFWMPEMGWAMQFLFVVVVTEFLSGAVFPLDIFPRVFQNVIYMLPFPYFVFFPLQIYLGKFSYEMVLNGLLIGGGWLIILYFTICYIWSKGLKKYSAEGI